MSIGKRRIRPSRAQLRPANPIDIHGGRIAQKRARLIGLTLLAGSILATAAIVHGFGPPFTYRVGQKPGRELRVNVVEFRRKDPLKTNADRQAAEATVAPRMAHDPAPIRELQEQLEDLVDEVSRAATIEGLPEPSMTLWGLDATAFNDLKSASDTPERRDDLHRWITRAFVPLLRDGVLGPQTLPVSEESHFTLMIRPEGAASAASHEVHKDRLLPERIKKPDGLVAKDFIAAFGNPRLGARIFSLVAERVKGTPTLRYEEMTTLRDRETARNRVKDAFKTYQLGNILVAQDERITEDHLALLRLEHETAVASLTMGERLRRIASVIVLVAALFAMMAYYIVRHEPKIANSPRKIAELCGLVVAALAIARLLAMQPWDAELIPLALTAMILAIAYNPLLALTVSFSLCLLCSLSLGAGLVHFLVLMGGTAAGVLPLREVRTRTKPIMVGVAAGLGYLVLTLATGLFQDQPLGLVATDGLWRGCWGLMTGFFLGGSLPFLEKAFGIVTGISLLELGDITHPAPARTRPAGARHAQPFGHGGDDCRGRRRTHRRQCASGADRGLFPRHRQDAQAALFRGEPGGSGQPSREPGPRHEHADHHRPREGRRGPGPSTSPARADSGSDRAASRDYARRIFLPRGHATLERRPRRRDRAGKRLPLPRAEAADQGSRHPDDLRLRGERQPHALGTHAVSHRQPRE